MMTLVDLVLFNRKVKLCKIGFSTGKSEKSGFSENFGASDLKVGRCRQLIQFMKYVVTHEIFYVCSKTIFWNTFFLILRR